MAAATAALVATVLAPATGAHAEQSLPRAIRIASWNVDGTPVASTVWFDF